MKKILYSLIVMTMIFSFSACNDSDTGIGDGNGNGGKLIAEENAVEACVNIRNLSSETVYFFLDPPAHEISITDGEISENGIYGTSALVAAKIKGEKAQVDGSFVMYANDKNGPSVTIPVKGSYEIDELNSYENNYFFNFQNGQFEQMTKEEWVSFN